jgi:hypothetical protein
MKSTGLLGLIVAMTVVVACGSGTNAAQKGASPSKETGPKAVLETMAGLAETLVESMEKADSASAVAAAFNDYGEGLEGVAPKWKAELEKHPELKGKIGMKDVAAPAELKPYLDRIVAAGDKMWDVMKKAEPYLKDEAVKKAQERMSTAIMKLEE